MTRTKQQHKARGGKKKANNGKSGLNTGGSGTVRIIGGRWRGSKLPIAQVGETAGLRPTGDRVRETLFNWLTPTIAGSRVLDVFAGSGALGLEAASRGAAEVVLIEQDRSAAKVLADTAERLVGNEISSEQSPVVDVICADALAWLSSQSGAPFDLVLIDPPFAVDLYQASFDLLAGWLKPGSLIYVESPADRSGPAPPNDWRPWKEKAIGQVRMQLLRKSLQTSPGSSPAQAL